MEYNLTDKTMEIVEIQIEECLGKTCKKLVGFALVIFKLGGPACECIGNLNDRILAFRQLANRLEAKNEVKS